MKTKLPISGHSVELEDYISQETVEAVEEITLGDVNMADESYLRVTDDEVAKVFPDLYDKIKKHKDVKEQEILMMKAKKRVVATDPNKGGVSAADFSKAQRVEVVYTIIGITLKDGKTVDCSSRDVVTKWVLKLPAPDYDHLHTKVREIGKKMVVNLEQAGEA